jgi:hypothetical protein
MSAPDVHTEFMESVVNAAYRLGSDALPSFPAASQLDRTCVGSRQVLGHADTLIRLKRQLMVISRT